jgi:hypothetical protein
MLFQGAASAAIVGSFDTGDTTASSVQSSFTAIGAAGATPAAYAGPQSATSGSITLRLTAGTTLAAATTKDGSGNFNSTAQLVARNRNVPAADSGTFTYSDVYRDFVTGNALGIQLSGLVANSVYAVTFYAYDNNGSRTQTFTDVTPGGTGFTGTATYTAAFAFTSGTPNNIFTTTIYATSDASGRLFFSETGVGVAPSTNVAVLGGVVVETSSVYTGFYHAYNGGFTDGSGAGNNGIPAGAASITTAPAAIAHGSGALSLDGADGSYVTLTTPGAFTSTSPWSATWWARRGVLGTDKGMVMGAASNTTDFIWLNDSFTGLRFRSSISTTFDFTTPKDMELRHYALVADGTGNLSLYLNGQLSQTLAGNTSFAIDTIGKAYPNTQLHYNFQGSLDEVHLINSALNATQVGEIYYDEKPVVPVTRLRIVLVGGQSNADGRAVISELPTSPVNLQIPQNDVDLYYKFQGGTATLTTLRPGLTETSQFGPDIMLGRRLADLYKSEIGTRVAIIRYANGGTDLKTQWKAGGDATTTGDGTEYVTFQQTVTQGLAALTAAYPLATRELQSMVWLQGESDSVSGLSNLYQANLTNFIADVRLTYGTSLPFVIARLSSQQTALNTTYLNEVRAAQDAVAAADPRTSIFATDNFGIKSDNLHFDGSGQQAIGSGFAEETAYYVWMNANFSAAEINAGLAEPNADRDGDGQSNRAEFLGATDPLSGASVFSAAFSPTGPGAGTISYESSASRVYSVQRYLEAGGTWETALPALQGTGSTVVRSLAATESRGIYRVKSELP